MPYPNGSFSWHHLWFILYLFLFSVIALPILNYLKSERSTQFKISLERLFGLKGGILMLVLPIIVSQVALRPYFPRETHALIDDWAYFIFYFLFFLAGILISSNPKNWESIKNQRRVNLAAASLSILLLLVMYYSNDWLKVYLPFEQTIWKVNKIIIAWSCVITIIGYGQVYLNKKSALLEYLNEAIYPFYILHQTAIIVIGFYVLRMGNSIFANFMIISFASLFSSFGIYVVLIRPFNIMRLLFGMKPKPVVKEKKVVLDIEFAG
ncbi:MAG: acyltransferase family protein [Proteobacteria bacterium]|nr:acyltransferase family protein [Pseudomonadota bacterium]